MNFKKVCAFLLCAAMAVTSVPISSVHAETGTAEAVPISAQDYEVTAGDIVEAGAYVDAQIDAGVQKNDLAPDFTSVGGTFKAGNYLKYSGIDFGSNAYHTMLLSVSAPGGQESKKIGVHIDAADGTKIGTITTQECAKATEFKDCYTEISEVNGVHDVYLVFEEDAEVSMDFFVFSGYDGADTEEEKNARMEWWRDAKYGQFIHWGAYAQLGGVYNGRSTGYAEWIMNNLGISREDYFRDAIQPFNPTEFDAAEVVKLAKDAGQKYLVLTSRHHEGFSMFDTKVREFKDYSLFSVANYGNYEGVDPTLELSKECEKQGIKFGVYYTIMDWHDKSQTGYGGTMLDGEKEEFKTRMKGQLRELLETYHVKVLFFDGEWPGWWTKADGQELYRYLRTIDPEVIVNNRVGKRHVDDGDYGTPEQEIPATGLDYDWESCMTLNNSWGYHKNDNAWKNANTVIDNLIKCTSTGGNYLLNIGPDEKGNVPQPSADIMTEAGTWLAQYGDSVYDTERSCFEKLPGGVLATTKEGKLYLHMTSFPQTGVLEIPKLVNEIQGIKVMGTETELSYDIIRDKMIIDLADVTEEKYDTVIEIDVNGKPEAAEVKEINYATKADRVSGTNQYDGSYGPEKAIDNNDNTRWATQDGTTAADLVLEYEEPITVNSCRIVNFNSPQWGNWVKAYSVDYWDGEKWVAAVSASEMGDEANHEFTPVTSTKFRLHIKEASKPSIWEFQLFNHEVIEFDMTSFETLAPTGQRPEEGIQIASLPFDVEGTGNGGSSVEVQLRSNNYVSELFTADIKEDGSWKIPVENIPEEGLYSVKAVMKAEDGTNMAVDTTSVHVRLHENLAKGKKTTVSTAYDSNWDGAQAVDGYTATRWSPTDDDTTPSITVDFEKPTVFNRIILSEMFDTWSQPNDYRCRRFEIRAFNGTDWKVIHEGTTIGEELTIDLGKEVTASKVQVNLLESKSSVNGKTAPANIEEIEVYYTGKGGEEKSTYTVTVEGGVIEETGAASGEYDYNNAVTVKADTPETGKKFAGWQVDGVTVSTEQTYKFYVSDEMTLTAVYVDENAEVTQEAKALMTNVIMTERPDGKYDVKFVGQLVVPKGYKIQDAGLVWSSKDGTELTLTNSAAKKTFIKKISNTNQFSVTIKGMPADRFMDGRIFAVLEKDSSPETFYSDVERAEVK